MFTGERETRCLAHTARFDWELNKALLLVRRLTVEIPTLRDSPLGEHELQVG